jgi:hypothetical protein
MNSGKKFLISLIMAKSAVHLLQSLGVGEFFHICILVAGYAV